MRLNPLRKKKETNMSEEAVVTPVLPIEQRIADVVVHASIAKMQDEDQLDAGHCTVEFKLYNFMPEYTPKDFTPTNDVEDFMATHEAATNLTLTLPFSFKLQPMIKGIAANIRNLENSFDCEVTAYHKAEDGSLQVELINRKLRRSLYVKMYSHPN